MKLVGLLLRATKYDKFPNPVYRRNIRYFGGDPESVTLMGESAGSIAATTHLLIPSSAGLFHRVIGLSGAPDTQKWQETYMDSARRYAYYIYHIQLVECNSNPR